MYWILAAGCNVRLLVMFQMASFQEQMTIIRKDLQEGLDLLESANNNAETSGGYLSFYEA